eukprot:SAG31_NODE_15876_length_734_cov_0.897638_1_plen_201_part_10
MAEDSHCSSRQEPSIAAARADGEGPAVQLAFDLPAERCAGALESPAPKAAIGPLENLTNKPAGSVTIPKAIATELFERDMEDRAARPEFSDSRHAEIAKLKARLEELDPTRLGRRPLSSIILALHNRAAAVLQASARGKFARRDYRNRGIRRLAAATTIQAGWRQQFARRATAARVVQLAARRRLRDKHSAARLIQRCART